MKTLPLLAVLGVAGCKQAEPPVMPKESVYTPREIDLEGYAYVHTHDCHWLWRDGSAVVRDSYGQQSVIPAMNMYDCRDGKSFAIFEKAKP